MGKDRRNGHHSKAVDYTTARTFKPVRLQHNHFAPQPQDAPILQQDVGAALRTTCTSFTTT
jgi:hypothetical protein